MTGPEALDVSRDAIWVMLQMSGPIMVMALTVGLAIALLQALTQVQEMTLVFVPKIITIFLSLVVLLPFMGRALGDFMIRIMALIAGG